MSDTPNADSLLATDWLTTLVAEGLVAECLIRDDPGYFYDGEALHLRRVGHTAALLVLNHLHAAPSEVWDALIAARSGVFTPDAHIDGSCALMPSADSVCPTCGAEADKLRMLADALDVVDRKRLADAMAVTLAEVPDYMVRAGDTEAQDDLRRWAAQIDGAPS